MVRIIFISLIVVSTDGSLVEFVEEDSLPRAYSLSSCSSSSSTSSYFEFTDGTAQYIRKLFALHSPLDSPNSGL
jgi:hypothetical protein